MTGCRRRLRQPPAGPERPTYSAASWYASIGRAGADEVAVAVGVVDAADRRPVLVLAQPRRREGRPARASRDGPTRASSRSARVRRVLQRVVLRGPPRRLDRARSPRGSRSSRRRSGRARPCDSLSVGSIISVPGTGNDMVGRVEAVVHQALGDVLDLDAGRLLERAAGRGCTRARRGRSSPRVEHRDSAARGAWRCSWRSGSRPRWRGVRPSPPIIAMYAQEIGRMMALPHGAADTGPIGCARRRSRRRRGWSGQERRQVRGDADRAHAGAAAAVRDAEGLVQVEVADVGADVAGPAQADLRVHVGAVHVDLAAVLVDDLADLLDRRPRTRRASTGR